MSWLAARRSALCVAALGLSLVVVLSGCSAAAEYLADGDPAATPEQSFAVASPVAPGASPAASEGAAATVATPTVGTAAEVVPLPDLGLVYARGTSVLQSGYLGGEAREIAAVPPYDTWAFDGGRLALALGSAIEVIDLTRGTQTSSRVASEGEIEFAAVFWGRSSEALLHVAVVADESAPTFGRRVELRALSADGRALGLVTLPDLAGITVLRYDDAAGTVAFIPRGESAFSEVRVVALADASAVATYAVTGEDHAAMSPDGNLVVTADSASGAGAEAGGASLVIYDLAGGATRRWHCPEGLRVASPVWSPDGRTVAFLLRSEGDEAAAPADDTGVWLLEDAGTELPVARLVMAEAGDSSALIGWTPDGSHVIGYHRGAGAGSQDDNAYVFAVRPDGGDRRILNLGADAQVLGWMPPADAEAETLATDPWPARFAQAQRDPDAVASAAAEFVAAHADRTDDELAALLADYLTGAGWSLDLGGPAVLSLDEGLYLAQLPPLSICLLEGGRAQRVASGDVLFDARRDGDVVGLIYGVIGASATQPAFVLLGKQEDGAWAPRWTPQGQRDWIATDGEIRFSGEGLEALTVSGSSFGIDLGEADPFNECHGCLHRQFSADWVRVEDGYSRPDALPAETPLAEVLWAMTEPSDYAVVHEALRRARAGEDAGDLATAEALVNVEALGLLAPGMRLLPEEAREGDVFLGLEVGVRYRATVRDGRLAEVAPENR